MLVDLSRKEIQGDRIYLVQNGEKHVGKTCENGMGRHFAYQR